MKPHVLTTDRLPRLEKRRDLLRPHKEAPVASRFQAVDRWEMTWGVAIASSPTADRHGRRAYLCTFKSFVFCCALQQLYTLVPELTRVLSVIAFRMAVSSAEDLIQGGRRAPIEVLKDKPVQGVRQANQVSRAAAAGPAPVTRSARPRQAHACATRCTWPGCCHRISAKPSTRTVFASPEVHRQLALRPRRGSLGAASRPWK